ncbi:hypothetical protein Tco_1530484 [Tanacetum coccineum]
MIAYASRQLKIHEKNYTTHDLDLGIKDRILTAQKEVVDEFTGLQKGLDEMIEQRSDGTLCSTLWEERKLAPRFVGPFKIIKKVGLVAYRLDLAEELNGVMTCSTCRTLRSHVEILEREFKKLKHSRIAIVKVRWNSKRGPEFTWEREDQMKLKYPHLFSDILYRVDGGDFVENYDDLWFIVINNPFWKLVGPLEEDLLDDEEKGDKDGDANDEGDDHISDTQDADDEDAETEYDVDEISKPDVENSEEEEECYIAEADVSSLMDIHIQQETPQIQSPSLRVAKLKKDVSELKKIDLSAEALAALKIQVPSIIDILDPKIGISLDRGENAMDKGVTDTIKDHKRKHDDDDDEDPLSFKTGKSASANEPVEEPTAEVVMDDKGEDVVRDDDQPKDTSERKTAKTPNPEWFTQPPRPPTHDPEWNKRQSPTKVGYDKDALKGIKHWGERHKLWHRSQMNKFSKHNVYSTKKILGVKSVSVKKLHGYGHLEEIMVKRVDRQLYKFKEGDMSRRKWTTIEKKRSKLMVELIDKQMLERRIIQNLERLVGARELEMDYKLMARTI